MATQRYISTSFWDDEWVQTLDPSEKLFYIYLLTNPLTNIAGVYKITDRRVRFDTGFSEEVVSELWTRFTRLNKAVRFEEWVIIPSWPRHQRWQDRRTIKTGIDKIIENLPENVLKKLQDVHYSYPTYKVPDPIGTLREGPSYLDSDSDSDSDSDLDTDTDSKNSGELETPPAFDDDVPFVLPDPAPTISPMKDSLAQAYQEAFVARTPAESWKSIPQERKHLNDLAARTRRMASVARASPEQLAASIIAEYDRLKRTTRDRYMRDGPWTPSGLTSRWDQVVEALRNGRHNEVPEELRL